MTISITDSKNYLLNKVRGFQLAFGQPAPNEPTELTAERVTNRGIWTAEEIIEMIQVSSDNVEQFNEQFELFLQGVHKAKEKALTMPFEREERLVNQVDAVIDQLYFVMGTIAEMGIDPIPFFDIVNDANMGKLHDGKVIKNELGKVQKPENWERDFKPEPKLRKELARQIKASQLTKVGSFK